MPCCGNVPFGWHRLALQKRATLLFDRGILENQIEVPGGVHALVELLLQGGFRFDQNPALSGFLAREIPAAAASRSCFDSKCGEGETRKPNEPLISSSGRT